MKIKRRSFLKGLAAAPLAAQIPLSNATSLTPKKCPHDVSEHYYPFEYGVLEVRSKSGSAYNIDHLSTTGLKHTFDDCEHCGEYHQKDDLQTITYDNLKLIQCAPHSHPIVPSSFVFAPCGFNHTIKAEILIYGGSYHKINLEDAPPFDPTRRVHTWWLP